MMRELISIRYDPPLPGNPPTSPFPETRLIVYHEQHNTKGPAVSAVREKGERGGKYTSRGGEKKGQREDLPFATRERSGAWVRETRTEKPLLLINQPG